MSGDENPTFDRYNDLLVCMRLRGNDAKYLQRNTMHIYIYIYITNISMENLFHNLIFLNVFFFRFEISLKS